MLQKTKCLFVGLVLLGQFSGCGQAPSRLDGAAKPASRTAVSNQSATPAMNDKVTKSEMEWKKQLTPEQFQILRQKGTERAFTGAYWNNHEKGAYRCAGCGAEMFVSDTKFDSGCGWPSFTAPSETNRIETREDRSHGMVRTEVLCGRCGGHLGHVFDDGPGPTKQRYCINSASLQFEKKPAPQGGEPAGSKPAAGQKPPGRP